jgi:ribonuclease D
MVRMTEPANVEPLVRSQLSTQNDPVDLVEVVGDLPDDAFSAPKVGPVGIDTETSGLNWSSEELGLVQVFISELNTVYLIRPQQEPPENLIRILESPQWIKVFHFALFDLRFLASRWTFDPSNIRCTKIASKLLSPTQEKHSLANLLETHLNVKLSKESSIRTSDWTAEDLSEEQLRYAAHDALYLPRLFDKLDDKLITAGRGALAEQCFSFIPTQLRADLMGINDLFGY